MIGRSRLMRTWGHSCFDTGRFLKGRSVTRGWAELRLDTGKVLVCIWVPPGETWVHPAASCRGNTTTLTEA